MRGAVLYEANTPLQIEDVSVDGPRDDEVLVRVTATGACHSDYHVMDGTWHGQGYPLPVILGHEAAGIVEKVGAERADHPARRPRDPVVRAELRPLPHVHDRSTEPVQRHDLPAGMFHDGTRRHRKGDMEINCFGRGMSSFAEYSVVHESAAIPIPQEVPMTIAALMGCAVMTGVGAVLNTAAVEPGSTVAVFATGGVGLNVVQGAVLANASRSSRWTCSTTNSTTPAVSARRTPSTPHGRTRSRKSASLTDGLGVDYAFDAIGDARVSRACYDAVRRGGTAVVVGMAPTGTEIPIPSTIANDEKVVKGCFYGSTRPAVDFPRLVDFYQRGALKLDGMITRTYSLEGINDAFAALSRGENARGVITP